MKIIDKQQEEKKNFYNEDGTIKLEKIVEVIKNDGLDKNLKSFDIFLVDMKDKISVLTSQNTAISTIQTLKILIHILIGLAEEFFLENEDKMIPDKKEGVKMFINSYLIDLAEPILEDYFKEKESLKENV